VVHDLVGYVDRHYRTDARASKRALVGHSMGGFGLLGMAAALDGSRTDSRLFTELPFVVRRDSTLVANSRVQARWLARMPPDRASAMVWRGDRPPVLVIEAGSDETQLRLGIEVLRARLDSLGIRYADTTFTGGHVDRVRERFTQHVLPTVGKWFAER
jgi:pimeloyl-ACP methyl ester carboxylesterase